MAINGKRTGKTFIRSLHPTCGEKPNLTGTRPDWSMVPLSGTSPARESCEQTKSWTIFGLHGQAEHGLSASRILRAGEKRLQRRSVIVLAQKHTLECRHDQQQ